MNDDREVEVLRSLVSLPWITQQHFVGMLQARRTDQVDVFSFSNGNNGGLFTKMAPVGVRGAPLHMGLCWMYGWLREAEKNSPSESYFLLLLLEYA